MCPECLVSCCSHDVRAVERESSARSRRDVQRRALRLHRVRAGRAKLSQPSERDCWRHGNAQFQLEVCRRDILRFVGRDGLAPLDICLEPHDILVLGVAVECRHELLLAGHSQKQQRYDSRTDLVVQDCRVAG